MAGSFLLLFFFKYHVGHTEILHEFWVRSTENVDLKIGWGIYSKFNCVGLSTVIERGKYRYDAEKTGFKHRVFAKFQSGSLIYNDGTLKVTAYKTQHYPDSFAYLLEGNGKRILCSGELRRPSVDFPDVRDIDAAILEDAHFDITEYTDVIKERNIKSAYINHYSIYIGRCEIKRVSALREGISHSC